MGAARNVGLWLERRPAAVASPTLSESGAGAPHSKKMRVSSRLVVHEEAYLVLSIPAIEFVRRAEGQAIIKGQIYFLGKRMRKAQRTSIVIVHFPGHAS